MRIAEVCIERPVLATVMSLVILLFGGISLLRLTNRELPAIDPPIVSVTTVFPGAAPEVVETSVTDVLEDQVTYATISLSLHEAGVVAPRGGGFSIVDAWATAGAAFLTVVGWILVGVAVAAPLLVLAALGYVVARILRSRLAHT